VGRIKVVLAEDPATGKVEAEVVHAAIADGTKPVMSLALSDGGVITVTADHPFWVDAGHLLLTSGWLHAGQLRVGDRLRTAGATEAVVVGLRRDVGRVAVYSLTVARDHTFFVGNAQVLVHNANTAACDAIFNGIRDGQQLPTDQALKLAIDYLGPGYREVGHGTGRYVSADGLRQVRIGEGDITGAHGGGPHINLEKYTPDPRRPGRLTIRKPDNKHIYLVP